ncbi:otoferlin-like protein [Leptotrombidium deliense]|uniref:Otoferlin-like protein n=1 Tax=Leptotrombidium deliense TaxID=299467 RepID=A0A443RXD8_9ACAR|nr:otoferlin-like protein [Leptotrombidium deliense]
MLVRSTSEEREVSVNSLITSEEFSQQTNAKAIPNGDVVVNIEKEKVKPKEPEDIDWWTKYYSSQSSGRRGSQSSNASSVVAQESISLQRSKLPKSQHFVIYSCELEKVAKYKSTSKRLHTYDLYRGKQKSNKEKSKAGKFKGALNLSKFPLPKVDPFDLISSNEPTRIFVRCYLVRAFDVKPKDIGGKADLYPIIKVGKQRLNDRENYIPNQLNPIFGRCYEFQATLPFESVLTVSLKDRDLIGSDDLIGATKIDLEDRFYCLSRSTCGLQRAYETSGFNAWRDSLKPSQILTSLCKELKLPAPAISSDCIKIGKLKFTRSLRKSLKVVKCFKN